MSAFDFSTIVKVRPKCDLHENIGGRKVLIPSMLTVFASPTGLQLNDPERSGPAIFGAWIIEQMDGARENCRAAERRARFIAKIAL